jgi:dinuclear metal center YbgI/SA1388 family protein
MHLNDLLRFLRTLAPENTAMDGDPVGLLIEPADENINSVVVCLDVTEHVIEYAKSLSAEIIVSHHPLIYHPLKRLDSINPISSNVLSLAKAGIGLYSMHTNWDIAFQGVNDTLASRMGLSDICDLPGAPIARMGGYYPGITPHELILRVSKNLNLVGTNSLRHTPLYYAHSEIYTVAVCGGAGASLMPHVIDCVADAFVTSDVRHDQFIDAAQRGILLIDAGHDATESPGMEKLASIMSENIPEIKVNYCPNWN